MRQFARALQIAAMLLLPLASILEIAHSITLGRMLQVWVIAICLFGIGSIAERYLRA